MKVIDFKERNLSDIPRVLRAIADEIEQGVFGDVTMAVVAIESENGNIETFGAGSADYYRGIALFELGKSKMVNGRLEDAS